MFTLNTTLTLDKCTFMHRDGVGSSAAYFKEFATIHLAVIYADILSHSKDTSHWKGTLETSLTEYATYGRCVVQELNKVGRE